MSSPEGLDRLGDAMAAWLEFRRNPQQPAGEFLAAHQSLRDLLQPMLDSAADDDRNQPAQEGSFGDFRLLRELGRGGMGVVYEARQSSLDRLVALKLLLPGSVADPRTLARFRREAAITARITHPGIVAVHAVGEHDGQPWFAMELVDGTALDRFATRAREQDPESWLRRAVTIVANVADALHHAHEAGVIHRDVKPSNILVRPDGTPVVTDFGLARSAGVPSLSQVGEFAGTPNYVSPEQAQGTLELDRRSDVFSLGVTLYELLTGELPFRGESSREVLDRIQRFEPRSPSRIDPELPRDVDAMVMMTLAKEPRFRYQDAAAFAADLRRFLAHRPVLARRPDPLRRVQLWARREPVRATLAGALAILVAMSVYVVWNKGALRRGNAELTADRVEDLLLQATIAPMVGMTPAQRGELLDRAADLGRDDQYTIVLIALALGNSPKGEARGIGLIDDFLKRHAPSLAMRRVRQDLAHRVDASAPLEDLPEPVDAIDHYVCGNFAMRRWARRESEAGALALEYMERAVALAERPRAMFFIGWNQAGRATETPSVVHASADALAHHWPKSAVSHLHRAMAWMEDDRALARQAAERSLQLAPDNFLGLELLAEIAELDGDLVRAKQLGDRAVSLYPNLAGFMRGDAHAPTTTPASGSSEGK